MYNMVLSSPQWLHSVIFLHVHHTVQSVLQKSSSKVHLSFRLEFQGPDFQSGLHSHSLFLILLFVEGPTSSTDAAFENQAPAVFKDDSEEIMKESAAQYILITHTYARTHAHKRLTRQ